MEPRLAFVVDVRQPSRKVFERVYVDGNLKEILEVKPDRYEVTDVKGQVTGMVITANLAIAAPVQVPIPGVTVNVAGVGTTVTDANGNYLITTGLSGPFNVSAGMNGPDYNVATAQGTLLSLNVPTNSHTPGVETADLFFNNPSDQFGTAQTNAAYHLMLVRGYTEAHFPGYLGFTPQQVSVNETSTCNAFYDPATKSIHFFATGGGCNNTCYGNVLYHEYSHGTDDYYGGILSSSLSEGTSDMFAMYICDSPIIGQDFQTGSFLRTGENNTVWPGSNCGNDPHCVGEVFMGFSWQGRKKLIASLGTPAGIAVAETDFIGIMPANPNGTLNATTQVFLNDDNDGDLTNGTPHFADLVAAAVMKGLPTPTFIPIHITNQRYPDTCNQTQPYLIYATIVPDAPNVLSTMVVNYSIEGGASGSVPMTPTGVADEYVGSVPAQVGPVVISYSITATDTAFNSVTLPATTGDAFRFAVGRKTTLLFDDLESGAAGWTHGAISGTDDWQLGTPQTAGTNSYDPTAAFSGNNVWGNDLQLTGGNGLYPSNSENWVDSPSINASGHTGVRLRFQRWLTVDKGSSDQATIAVNGTQIFANPTVGQFIDKAWMSQDIAAPSGDNVASFKTRWRVKTNFGTNLGGWNIDDIEVYALESTPVLTLNLGVSSTTPPRGRR